MVMPLGCHDCKFNKGYLCNHPLTLKKHNGPTDISLVLSDPDLCGTLMTGSKRTGSKPYVSSFSPKLLKLPWYRWLI